MSIESLIPKINIPTMGSLLGRTIHQPDPQDTMLEQLAEQQIDEEKDTENALMTMLDWLGRPQAAVAGVLTDLVDGGDFSPFDRVSHAIMGEERHRMKDFLDEIAPGEWSNVRLPDWMGGSDFDIMKQGVGFVGDIFTDPLMAVNTFTSLGNVARGAGQKLGKFHGGKLAGSKANIFSGKEGAELLGFAADNKKIAGQLSDANRKAMEAMHVADASSAAMVVQHMRLRELHKIWDDVLKDPEAYAAAFKNDELGKGFLENIAPYLSGKNKDPRTLLAPTMGARFKRGEASLLAVRVPWLMRTVGIPDGQFSLIPKIADEWTGAMMEGLDKLTAGIRYNTEVGRSLTGWGRKMLSWGTGVKEADALLTMSAAGRNVFGTAHHKLDEALEATSNEVTDIFRGMPQVDKDTVMGMVRQPGEFSYTAPGWLAPRDIPEHLQEPVARIRSILGERFDELSMTPGQKVNFMGVGKEGFSNKRAYEEFVAMGKAQNADLHMPLWKDIRKVAKADTIKEAKRMGWKTTKIEGDLLKRELTKNETEMLRASFQNNMTRLNHFIPNPELAYFPRFVTKEAQGITGLKALNSLMQAGKLTYHGSDASIVWNRALPHRVLTDFDVPTFNKMAKENTLPYDFLNDVFTQANKNLKGRDKKLLDHVFGGMSADQVALFIDDPTKLLTKYLTDTNHAIKLQHKMNLMIKTFARDASGEKWVPGIGERLVLLSSQGMRARYGESWKETLGEEGYKMWKSLTKRTDLEAPDALNKMFHTMDERTLSGMMNSAKSDAFNLPMHAIPGDIMDGMERFVRMSQEPTYKSWAMRQFVGITNVWKATTLAFFPAYHARNFINGFWQAGLGDSLHVPSYTHATRTIASVEGGTAKSIQKAAMGNADSLTKQIVAKGWNGKPITRDDAYKYAMDQRVLSKGFFSPDSLNMTGGEVELLSKRFSKAYNMTVKKATDKLFSLGNDAENVHRLSHFMNRLSKGDDPFQAAQSVKKYFYNFDELSPFDKAIMPFFPFWNWTRKNTPATAEALMTNPGAFAQAGRIVQAGQDKEAEGMDPRLLPKWVNKNLGVPTKFDEETGQMSVRLWNQWMGWTDLRDWVGLQPEKGGAGVAQPCHQGAAGTAAEQELLYGARD